MSTAARIRRLLGRQPDTYVHPDLLGPTEEDRRYLNTLHDDAVPLPAAANEELLPDNPVLEGLRNGYAALELPVLERSRWQAVSSFLDLRYFRGESLFVWHYRELPRVSRLKYFLYAQYVKQRDTLGLLDRLEEDGAFGCWTFSYPGWKPVSRDLLQSVNEISFLERQLAVARRARLRVLDIGAGYGRLAQRMAQALPNLADYCCVDAIPEATFVSDWYLRFSGCVPPCRVVRLDRVQSALKPGSFDLAVNIHSFSECPLQAIEWWVSLLASLEVPALMIVPNEPDQLLSNEADGSRRDFSAALKQAGFRLDHREPVLDDPAVEELFPLHDRFHLFTRDPA